MQQAAETAIKGGWTKGGTSWQGFGGKELTPEEMQEKARRKEVKDALKAEKVKPRKSFLLGRRGTTLPRGVYIVWKSKRGVKHSSNGIGSYQARCKLTKCKRANPKGAGKQWSANCQTIEAAAQAFEQHCRDPFDLGRKDLMHWA